MECPLYLAFLIMGGITSDKTSLKLSDHDSADLKVGIHQRNERRKARDEELNQWLTTLTTP